jgi:hypothetical protein
LTKNSLELQTNLEISKWNKPSLVLQTNWLNFQVPSGFGKVIWFFADLRTVLNKLYQILAKKSTFTENPSKNHVNNFEERLTGFVNRIILLSLHGRAKREEVLEHEWLPLQSLSLFWAAFYCKCGDRASYYSCNTWLKKTWQNYVIFSKNENSSKWSFPSISWTTRNKSCYFLNSIIH